MLLNYDNIEKRIKSKFKINVYLIIIFVILKYKIYKNEFTP